MPDPPVFGFGPGPGFPPGTAYEKWLYYGVCVEGEQPAKFYRAIVGTTWLVCFRSEHADSVPRVAWVFAQDPNTKY